MKSLAGRISNEAARNAAVKLRVVHAEEYAALYAHERAVLETVYGYRDARSTTGAQAASARARAADRDSASGHFK